MPSILQSGSISGIGAVTFTLESQPAENNLILVILCGGVGAAVEPFVDLDKALNPNGDNAFEYQISVCRYDTSQGTSITCNAAGAVVSGSNPSVTYDHWIGYYYVIDVQGTTVAGAFDSAGMTAPGSSNYGSNPYFPFNYNSQMIPYSGSHGVFTYPTVTPSENSALLIVPWQTASINDPGPQVTAITDIASGASWTLDCSTVYVNPDEQAEAAQAQNLGYTPGADGYDDCLYVGHLNITNQTPIAYSPQLQFNGDGPLNGTIGTYFTLGYSLMYGGVIIIKDDTSGGGSTPVVPTNPFPLGNPQLVWFKGANAQVAGEPYSDYQIVPLWQMTVLNGQGVGLTDLRKFGGLTTGNFPSQANAGPTYSNSSVTAYANLDGLLQDFYATTTITNIPTDGSVGRIAWAIRKTAPSLTYPLNIVMTPASMTNISAGTTLVFDVDGIDQQSAVVSAITSSTFTVTLTAALTQNPITIQSTDGTTINTTLASSEPNILPNIWSIWAETDIPNINSNSASETVSFGYGQVSTGVAYDLGCAFVNTGGFIFSDITTFISNYTSPLTLAIPNHYLLNGSEYEPTFTAGISAFVGSPTFSDSFSAVVPTPGANGITTAFELNFTFNNQPQDGSLVGVGCYYRAEGASAWSFYGELPAVGVGGQPATLPGIGNYQFTYADLSNGIQWQFGANAIGLNNEQSDIFYIADSPAVIPFNTSSTVNLIVDSGLAAGQFHGGSSGFKTGSVCSSNPYWYLFGLNEPNVVISGPGNGTGGSGSFAMDAEGGGRFGGITSPITVIPGTEYAISFVCHNQYSTGTYPSIAIVDSTGSNTYTTTYAEIHAPDAAQNQKVNTTWTCPEDGSVTNVAFKADSNGCQAQVPGYVIFTEFQMQVAPVSAYSPGPATPGTGTVTQSLKVTPSAVATSTTSGSDASDVGNAPSIEAGLNASVPVSGTVGSLYMVTDAADSSHALYTAGFGGQFAPVPHTLANQEDVFIFSPPLSGQVLTYTAGLSGGAISAWTGAYPSVQKYQTTFTGSASAFTFMHYLNDPAPLLQIYDNNYKVVPLGLTWTAQASGNNAIIVSTTSPPGTGVFTFTALG